MRCTSWLSHPWVARLAGLGHPPGLQRGGVALPLMLKCVPLGALLHGKRNPAVPVDLHVEVRVTRGLALPRVWRREFAQHDAKGDRKSTRLNSSHTDISR